MEPSRTQQPQHKAWFNRKGKADSLMQISLVTEKLAISDLDCAICPERLSRAGIRSILSIDSPSALDLWCCREDLKLNVVEYIVTEEGALNPDLFKIGVKKAIYHPMRDCEKNSEESYRQVLEKLDLLVKEAPPVLVHCAAGASRSPSVVAAYIAKTEGITFKEAVRRIQKHRPTALSPGFVTGIVKANSLMLS